MNDSHLPLILIGLAFAAGVFLGAYDATNRTTQATVVSVCGECIEVRECGSFVCVPGNGWMETKR